MSEDAEKFDRELGGLVRVYRTAKGLTREDVAEELGLTSAQIEQYEAGSNRLSVYRYWMIMSMLEQDPAPVLDQLQQRLALRVAPPGDAEGDGFDFLASNRGRQVINALAMCDRPEVLNALADLIVAVGVHSRARTREPRGRAETLRG